MASTTCSIIVQHIRPIVPISPTMRENNRDVARSAVGGFFTQGEDSDTSAISTIWPKEGGRSSVCRTRSATDVIIREKCTRRGGFDGVWRGSATDGPDTVDKSRKSIAYSSRALKTRIEWDTGGVWGTKIAIHSCVLGDIYKVCLLDAK